MRKKIVALGTVLLLAASVTAHAGTTFENYSTTVGAFNGSGYTDTQIKATNGAAADLNSGSVGGNYVVDVRQQLENGSGSGSWTRNVDDATNYLVDGTTSQTSGSKVRLQFSNDWNTPVSVQVSGKWRSN